MTIKTITNNLTTLELYELKEYLISTLKDIDVSKGGISTMLTSENGRHNCKYCNISMYKNGKTKTGVQKYICKQCKNTCSQTTGTLTFASKFPFKVWEAVIENLLHGLSIRIIAKENNISFNSSFNLRHKVLKAVHIYLDNIKLTGEVQADEKYLKINLKGTKPCNMPRYSKKRASSGMRGISHHKVCVLTAIDDNENVYAKITGLGNVTSAMINDNLKDVTDNNASFTIDSKTSYLKFFNENKIKYEMVASGKHKTKSGKNLGNINNVHSQLESFLSKFRGVSTKHLPEYLDWFSVIFSLCRRIEYKDLKMTLCKNIIKCKEYITKKDIFKKTFPVSLETAYSEYNFGIFACS